MRRIAIAAMALLAVGLTASPALAASPHLKGRNPLSFTVNGLTLTATVSYAGLGNFDTLQVLDATGIPTATCTNPSGANQPPGQNPAEANVTGATPVAAGDIKNGNVTITTTTDRTSGSYWPTRRRSSSRAFGITRGSTSRARG